MRTYFLTHCYPSGLRPLASVMDMPREEADALTAKLMGRATDRDSYYDHRKLVEDWLRAEARRIGVRIENDHPLYFDLTAQPHNEIDEESGAHFISLPVAEIDLSLCSFTIGDSFCNYEYVITEGRDCNDMPPNNFLGRVLGPRDASSILEGYRIYAHESEKHAQVEVQMWARLPDRKI